MTFTKTLTIVQPEIQTGVRICPCTGCSGRDPQHARPVIRPGRDVEGVTPSPTGIGAGCRRTPRRSSIGISHRATRVATDG
jgi:hypothetical protein